MPQQQQHFTQHFSLPLELRLELELEIRLELGLELRLELESRLELGLGLGLGLRLRLELELELGLELSSQQQHFMITRTTLAGGDIMPAMPVAYPKKPTGFSVISLVTQRSTANENSSTTRTDRHKVTGSTILLKWCHF